MTINEMPSHTHMQNAHNHIVSDYLSGYSGWATQTILGYYVQKYNYGHIINTNLASVTTNIELGSVGIAENTVATNKNTGGSEVHNNLQPYITVYMWKRTA